METTKRSVGRPKGSKYPVFVGCRLPQRHDKFIASMAKNQGMKRSDIIRTIIDSYMQRYSRK